MDIKLFDSERRVMECLWDRGDLSAKELAAELNAQVGWSKTTTYTVIKKCLDKGAVQRRDPGFLCHALISRSDVCKQETDELIQRNFNGRADRLVASLLDSRKLSKDEIAQLKEMIEKWR